MRSNIGPIDKSLRAMAAVVIVVTALSFGAVAAVFLITSLLGVGLLYLPLIFSARKKGNTRLS